MTVTIILTLAGNDTGPFDLYSDVDGYTSAFIVGVSRGVLVTGLTTGTVPDGTTNILVQSTGACERDLYLTVAGAPTTTTTSTTTSTTSTTTTSIPCYNYIVEGVPSIDIEWTDCDGIPDSATVTDAIIICAQQYSVYSTGGEGNITETSYCGSTTTTTTTTPNPNREITIHASVRDEGTYDVSIYYQINSGGWLALIGNYPIVSCFNSTTIPTTITAPVGATVEIALCFPTSSGDYNFYASTSISETCSWGVIIYCGQATPYPYTVVSGSNDIYIAGFQTPTSCP